METNQIDRGGGENRTRVRKSVHLTVYERMRISPIAVGPTVLCWRTFALITSERPGNETRATLHREILRADRCHPHRCTVNDVPRATVLISCYGERSGRVGERSGVIVRV